MSGMQIAPYQDFAREHLEADRRRPVRGYAAVIGEREEVDVLSCVDHIRPGLSQALYHGTLRHPSKRNVGAQHLRHRSSLTELATELVVEPCGRLRCLDQLG